MNLGRFAAAAITLIGSTAAADGETDGLTATGFKADAMAAAEAPATAQVVRWDDFADDRSSLLPQARAVFAAQGLRSEFEDVEVTVTTVSALNDEAGSSPAGDCRVMANPGSRILQERCFFPSPVERRLDEYQYRSDIRYLHEEALRQQMREQNARDAALQHIQNAAAGP